MMEWNPSTIRITMARRLLSARLVADIRLHVPPGDVLNADPRPRLAGRPWAFADFSHPGGFWRVNTMRA